MILTTYIHYQQHNTTVKRVAGRPTDRQTDRPTNGQTDRQTLRLIELLSQLKKEI